VRSLVIALCLIGSAAAAQKPAGPPKRPNLPELPGPKLRITDSLVMDGAKWKFEQQLNVNPGPNGRIIVHVGWTTLAAFDSMGRRLWSKEKTRDRDVGEVTAVGWRGNEMWISDASFSQIALFDQFGNVTKSLELPSWVRPTFSNRKTFPVFESMRVFAMLPNDEMIVMPRNRMGLVNTPGYDEKSNYIVKVNGDGIIQRTIAKVGNNMLEVAATGKEGRRFQSSYRTWGSRVSPDGMRTVVVRVDTIAPKSDTVIVTGLDDKGDTVYVRKFGYPAHRWSDTQIDSVGRVRYSWSSEQREQFVKSFPRRVPSFIDMTMDYDKSVWITLRQSGGIAPIIGIDPTGKVIGSLTLPMTLAIKAADRGRLWVSDTRLASKHDLVRYTLGR
jgi:hypothetical protein